MKQHRIAVNRAINCSFVSIIS